MKNINQDNIEFAQKLVNYINSLSNFSIPYQHHFCYNHIGATLSDMVLQAGLNYKYVVEPRIRRIIINYPEAKTTTKFYTCLQHVGVNLVLSWNHHEKPRRLLEVTKYFLDKNIETEDNLRDWLLIPTNCYQLMKINGIGPKSVDYLKNLVNLQSIAVDRHIRKFVNLAGMNIQDYSDIQTVVSSTANIMCIEPSILDHAIWLYMSENV
jgi:hypothetical protein